MKKIKIIERSFLILLILEIITIIVLMMVMGITDNRVYLVSAITLSLIDPLIFLILEAVKESLSLDYSGSKYISISMASLMISGATFLFLYFNFLYDYFPKFWYLFYVSILISFLIALILTLIYKKRSIKKGANGPRIIANK